MRNPKKILRDHEKYLYKPPSSKKMGKNIQTIYKIPKTLQSTSKYILKTFLNENKTSKQRECISHYCFLHSC